MVNGSEEKWHLGPIYENVTIVLPTWFSEILPAGELVEILEFV